MDGRRIRKKKLRNQKYPDTCTRFPLKTMSVLPCCAALLFLLRCAVLLLCRAVVVVVLRYVVVVVVPCCCVRSVSLLSCRAMPCLALPCRIVSRCVALHYIALY